MSIESITCVDPNIFKAFHKKEKKESILLFHPHPPFLFSSSSHDLPPITQSPHVIMALGTLVMFHSARVFISFLGSSFSICTASVICLSIGSFLYVPVIFIWNPCICLLCISLQCFHSADFSLCALRSDACFFPLV